MARRESLNITPTPADIRATVDRLTNEVPVLQPLTVRPNPGRIIIPPQLVTDARAIMSPGGDNPNSGTYARQDSLELSIPARVAVIGCGGVGSWLAYFLALAGCPEIWLWDHDEVSQHNLNRLPLTAAALGTNKAEALATLIKAARPNCETYAMHQFSSSQADACGLGTIPPGTNVNMWLVATTDTWASRKEAYEWTRDKWFIRYLEAAAEGEFGSITGEPAQWATEDEVKPGYASVPVWVGPCVFAASAACAHILHNHPLGDTAIRSGFSPNGLQFYNSSDSHSTPTYDGEHSDFCKLWCMKGLDPADLDNANEECECECHA